MNPYLATKGFIPGRQPNCPLAHGGLLAREEALPVHEAAAEVARDVTRMAPTSNHVRNHGLRTPRR
jgi:hypothetical protein